MSLRLTPPPGRTDELLAAFRLLAARAKARPGCLNGLLKPSGHRKNVVVYEETWNSWNELAAYIQSDSYLRLLQLMETSIRTPSLLFEGPDRSCGIEYVQALRSRQP